LGEPQNKEKFLGEKSEKMKWSKNFNRLFCKLIEKCI